METIIHIEEIKRLIPHRFPFLLIDRVTFLKEKEIHGIKNVSINEPFFQGHFPSEAVMPGVLQIEAMAQLAACYAVKWYDLKNPSVYFMSINKVKFRRKVVPGDVLKIQVLINSDSKSRLNFSGVIYVEGEKASEAEMNAIMKI